MVAYKCLISILTSVVTRKYYLLFPLLLFCYCNTSCNTFQVSQHCDTCDVPLTYDPNNYKCHYAESIVISDQLVDGLTGLNCLTFFFFLSVWIEPEFISQKCSKFLYWLDESNNDFIRNRPVRSIIDRVWLAPVERTVQKIKPNRFCEIGLTLITLSLSSGTNLK